MKTFSSDRRKIKESISTLSDLNVHANRPLIKIKKRLLGLIPLTRVQKVAAVQF